MSDTGGALNREYWRLCNPSVKLSAVHDGIEHACACGKMYSAPNAKSRSKEVAIPSLHLDANLAIAEACRVFAGRTYSMHHGGNGNWWLMLVVDANKAETYKTWDGPSFNEAILRALIAAAKEGKS